MVGYQTRPATDTWIMKLIDTKIRACSVSRSRHLADVLNIQQLDIHDEISSTYSRVSNNRVH